VTSCQKICFETRAAFGYARPEPLAIDRGRQLPWLALSPTFIQCERVHQCVEVLRTFCSRVLGGRALDCRLEQPVEHRMAGSGRTARSPAGQKWPGYHLNTLLFVHPNRLTLDNLPAGARCSIVLHN
jgi:hypothetical protein